MINWTLINEITNLIAVAVQLVLVVIAIKFYSAMSWSKYLFYYFLGLSILDIITFYVYKFLGQDSYYLSPFYLFTSYIPFAFLYYFALPNKILKRGIIIVTGVLSSLFLFKLTLLVQWNAHNIENSFLVKIYKIIVCLIAFNFILKDASKSLVKTPLFMVTMGFFMNSMIPIVSDFIRKHLFETSPEYFQISLMIMNITAIIAYYLMGRGLVLLRKPIIPASFPML